MATPRMFISSTCYDLHEIRHNLRTFIRDFNYEPVMSEYGDIFYEYDIHAQDSCLREIEKSQMYILIIGNNYGSIYHKEKKDADYPDSITLSEFRKSIEINIPKMIFINKFVYYDYRNYKKSLTEYLANYFKSEQVIEEDIEVLRKEQINLFDEKYYFPQHAYKYIFRFLDVIVTLQKNNAIFEYDTFDEIKETLKKQWAGFLYDKLSEYQEEIIEKEKDVTLEDIKNRISLIDRFLREAFDNNKSESGEFTISLKKIEDSFALDDLKIAQQMLDESLESILFDYNYRNRRLPRIEIKESFTDEIIIQWLQSLDKIINTFKWSQSVSVVEVFEVFKYAFWESRSQIPLESLIKLNTLFKSLPVEEINNITKTIRVKFEKLIKDDTVPPDFPDDIPF